MNYRFLYILLLVLSINLLSAFSVSAENLEEKPGTIREMQENIKALEKQKSNLEFKWRSFNIWKFSLWDLIDTTLNESEKSTLEKLVIDYSFQQNNISTENLTGSLLESTQQEKLYLKRDFYKSLLVYIDGKKQWDFKLYIENDLLLNEKTETVGVEIQRIQETKNERVEEIQTKIENNNKKLRQNIQQKVINSISSKLETFTQNQKFSELSWESKIKVFETVQGRLKVEINKLENLKDGTSIIEEKINIYKVIISQLESYIEVWKK